ncbi:MAG: hypothetical protein JXA57_15235 [Armatimonadetes bacterium]|nr:hypothetical protein [Armatimonadota bacterium]
MAGAIDPGVRAWLEDRGAWRRFCAIRDEFRKRGVVGDPAAAALAQVRKEFSSSSADGAGPVGALGAAGSAPLIVPATFADRAPSTPLKDAQWVYGALGYRASDVDLTTAPSPGAVALLRWARDNQGTFFRDIWAKLLPSRSALEDEIRRHDDGSKQLELLDRVSTIDADEVQ